VTRRQRIELNAACRHFFFMLTCPQLAIPRIIACQSLSRLWPATVSAPASSIACRAYAKKVFAVTLAGERALARPLAVSPGVAGLPQNPTELQAGNALRRCVQPAVCGLR
jgi:hypothetical protein